MQEKLLAVGDQSITWNNCGVGIYCINIKYLFPNPENVNEVQVFANRVSSQTPFSGEMKSVDTILELNKGNVFHFDKVNSLLYVCPFAFDHPLLSSWRIYGI